MGSLIRMKKIIILLFLFSLTINFVFSAEEPGTGGVGGGEQSNPFKEVYKFFHDPFYQTLRCGRREGEENPPSATLQVIRCAFDVLEVLKNFSLILMAIAFIGAALYLISTPFFGLKQISVAWNILIWTPVGMVIVFLGDIIKDQIEKLFLR